MIGHVNFVPQTIVILVLIIVYTFNAPDNNLTANAARSGGGDHEQLSRSLVTGHPMSGLQGLPARAASKGPGDP